MGLLIVYVFAIVLTQLLEGKRTGPGEVGYDYFRSVSHSMSTLLLQGALPDQAGLVEEVGNENLGYYFIMVIYFFLASLTLMNMLVGVLCEVVSTVSNTQSEEIQIHLAKSRLNAMLEACKADSNDNGTISKTEFRQLLPTKQFCKTLTDLGVDVLGLVDLSDYIFESNNELSISDFMEVILQLRGSNTATVKDIVDLRKLVVNELTHLSSRFAYPVGAKLLNGYKAM